LAVIAEVRIWPNRAFTKDDTRILLAGLVPVPTVRFCSLNILAHPDAFNIPIKKQIFLICAPKIAQGLILKAEKAPLPQTG
jgi:hypothetical protein